MQEMNQRNDSSLFFRHKAQTPSIRFSCSGGLLKIAPAYLDDGDVFLRRHLSDVILELDDDFDQIHDVLVHLVLGAVQLSCGRRLSRRK